MVLRDTNIKQPRINYTCWLLSNPLTALKQQRIPVNSRQHHTNSRIHAEYHVLAARDVLNDALMVLQGLFVTVLTSHPTNQHRISTEPRPNQTESDGNDRMMVKSDIASLLANS